MARILAVGIATLDWVFEVDRFPTEDEEMRARSMRLVRGGNATNTLSVLAQYGHRCDWAGVIANTASSQLILNDLAGYGINTDHCVRKPGQPPTSSILLTPSGSRTIVHFRDLPEFDFNSFAKIDLHDYDWLHFEGRNIYELEKMLMHARKAIPGIPISLEAEKPRPALERVLGMADVVLASRALAQSWQQETPDAFLLRLRRHNPQATLVAGWGTRGAYALDPANQQWHSPAYPPDKVIDSIGAGDTFNAGMIDGLVRGLHMTACLQAACHLAGRKCGVLGFDLR